MNYSFLTTEEQQQLVTQTVKLLADRWEQSAYIPMELAVLLQKLDPDESAWHIEHVEHDGKSWVWPIANWRKAEDRKKQQNKIRQDALLARERLVEIVEQLANAIDDDPLLGPLLVERADAVRLANTIIKKKNYAKAIAYGVTDLQQTLEAMERW